MSYILEALKKVEQKRQREEPANFLTVQAEVSRKSRKWVIWLSGIIVLILLLNTGILIWWFSSRHSDGETDALASVRPAQGDRAGSDEWGAAAGPVAGPAAREAAPAAAAARALEEKVGVPAKQAAGLPAKTTAPRGEAGARSQVRTSGNGNGLRGPTALDEMSQDAKDGLPHLAMSVHLYHAEPASRMAVINNKTVREGQYLAPGLKVEEITPQGVILLYGDHRILLGINENR